MDLKRYENKKILILGLGREGLVSLRFFLENCPQARIGVADIAEISQFSPEIKDLLAKNTDVEVFSGKDYILGLTNYDIVIKTPGIPIHIPEIEQAFSEGKITSQTEIFMEQCSGTMIGVTGTKGKSTTSSIIYEILKAAGKKVSLVGNIGTPMLSFLKDATAESFFVCELSAHQLYGLKKSPHISVLLNIYQEHLDYYKDYNEYIRSKANIAINQSKDDYLIYNSSNMEVDAIAKESAAKKIAFNEYDWKFGGKTALIGGFNLENAKVGAIVGRILGIGDEVIDRAIADFKPLDNRLEFAGNFNGVDCYNDSLSTIQESAVAAIAGLGEKVQTLVAGGFDRHQPFDKLATAILESNIKTLLLFPTTGERIWEQIEKQASILKKGDRLAGLNHYFVATMEEAARLALANTDPGRICVLSAASASFGNFRDYADRGNCYKKCLAEAAAAMKFENNA
jgi:UDP-N-acetylmuramoylalanine--D-glutamate ligase